MFSMNYFIKAVLLFVAYIMLARIGATIATEHVAAAVWIPSGVAITSILLFGYRFWPSIALGEFIVNWYFTPLPPDVSLAMAIGDTIETLLAVYILKYYNFQISFHRLRDVILLYLAAVFCTIISATFGISSLYLKGIVSSASYFEAWKAWWVANTLSIMIIPPVILTWRKMPKIKISVVKVIEYFIFVVIMLGIDSIIFHKIFHAYIDNASSTYLIFPPLIWTALRFGVGGTAAVIFIVASVSIIETSQGLGPFIDGSLAHSLLSLQTFIGTMGATIMILAAVESERKALEQRKDEFINIASHELRTPLTSIKAYSQILLKIPSENKFVQIKGYLKKMDYQINNMTQLINSLLNISKIQIGRFEMDKKIFCVDNLVKEVVKDIQATHPKHKLLIKNFLKNNCNIYADKNYITQVIVNLLVNAIKYSPGKSRIIIEMRIIKEKTVEVSIKDYGIGITKEEKNKIFDKYYRVASEKESTVSGLGIGLYISKQIIKSHAGRISVISTKGKGSTFSFYLPVVRKN